MSSEVSPAPRRSRANIRPLLVVGGILAAVVAAALTALTGTSLAADLGLSDPGALTNVGMPVVRAASEVASVVCIGSLLLAAFLVPPRDGGRLAADGYAALRTAGWAALVWCVGALLAVPLTISDSTGQPVGTVLAPGTFGQLFSALEQAKAWLATAIIVAIVALATRFVLSWGATAVLFFLAVAGWAPIAFTGHSSAGGDHDLAMSSLLIHLIAATVWVGGLVALLAHARRRGAHLPLAAARFSTMAVVAWALMAVTGEVNALVRLPLTDLFDTGYGWLVVTKTVLLLALGGFGYLQRSRAIPALRAGKSGALVRFAVWEVLVMFATIGVAAALSRTAPPPDTAQPSTVELLIGYNLSGPPTLARLLFDWRFDLLFGTAAIVLAVAYLAGVRRLTRRGDRWSRGRLACWLAGCAVLLLATSSGVGRYAPAMFSVHMVDHMVLGMLVPILLCLGGPVTLAMRALRPAGRGNPPGPREWLLAVVHSPVTRVLTHPVLALALFVGSFYVLYFSGLFDAAVPNHWAHILMNLHFLLVGYLFFWPVIGADPAPRRLPYLARLGLMLASMPFHAFFGVILMGAQTPVGENFYRSLSLPWVPDLLADQRLGGGIAWAFGEIPLIIVVIVLVLRWNRDEDRKGRAADRHGDADLAAYNAMLAKLSGGAGDAG